MSVKSCIEDNLDVKFLVLLGNNDTVNQQPKVGVADGSFLNDLLD